MAREDFRQRLTNALVQSLEEHNALPWQQRGKVVAVRPFNPASGVKYKGGNFMGLALEQARRGSSDPRWMTLKQANKAGYSIRKNAKAAYVEYWDYGVPGLNLAKPRADDSADNDDETDEQARARTRPRPFYAAVFNGEDVVGLPKLERSSQLGPALAARLIAATGAEIDHTGGQTGPGGRHYSRSEDKITVPALSEFKSEGAYYATMLHALALWTGHPSRLDRQAFDGRAALESPTYAREDLRAEIATFLLVAALGVDGTPQKGRYAGARNDALQGWLDALQGDKHELFRAARDAEQIVDHIFGYAPELREIAESALAANILPEEGPQRRVNFPVSDGLPNFVPPGAMPAAPVVRTGRADPRWTGFEETLLATAKKAGLAAESVIPALDLVEPDFTTVMNTMKERGVDEETVYKMIGTQIVDEMKQADAHHRRMADFADRVRANSLGAAVSVEQLESALHETRQRYDQVLIDAANGRWDDQKTLQELNQVLYGAEIKPPVIDGAFVERLVMRSAAAQSIASPQVPDDDDDLLVPLGMADVLPDDAGIVDDERFSRASP